MFQQRLEKLNDDFMFFTARKYPADEKTIADFEQKHGITFVPEYKEFLLSYGLLILEVIEDVWRRPQQYDVMPAWKFGYGFFIFGMADNPEVPEWMLLKGIDEPGLKFFQRTGNSYRAYMDKTKIILADCDEGFEEDGGCEEFGGNFWDFLIAEVDKLENDYKRYIAG